LWRFKKGKIRESLFSYTLNVSKGINSYLSSAQNSPLYVAGISYVISS
jgi:hypothetical protein